MPPLVLDIIHGEGATHEYGLFLKRHSYPEKDFILVGVSRGGEVPNPPLDNHLSTSSVVVPIV